MAGPERATLAGNAKLGGFATHSVTQEQATADVLAGLVDDGELSDEQAALLAYHAGELGVLGPFQAEHAAKTYSNLSAAERATFDALLADAGSDLEHAYLFKALSAHGGGALAEIGAFASLIRGKGEDWLHQNLTLTAPRAVVGAPQNGVRQQFADTCVPTSAQALKGELDPVYALAMRLSNVDVHGANDTQPLIAGNDVLQAEQLHGGGGSTRSVTPRNQKPPNGINANQELIFNLRIPELGFLYSKYRYATWAEDGFWRPEADDPSLPEYVHGTLDELAAQLERGIPAPLGFEAHKTLAIDVDGEGPDQKFLIHDPYTATTGWFTREQLVTGQFDMIGTNVLVGFTEIVEPGDLAYQELDERRDTLRDEIEGLP
jgi:hypothetical protein